MLHKLTIICGLLIWTQLFGVALVWAGPYPPAADEFGSHAISKDDPSFVGWASAYVDYMVGDAVDAIWQEPLNALGPAEGTSWDCVALGRGGRITLTFDQVIQNGDGWDFAIFENSFSDFYLELAFVEVSSNGVDFVRFDATSLTVTPVPGFGNIDPTDVDGLAGKYRQGFGTPFDLEELATKSEVLSGNVDLMQITHIRIVDIVGDGSSLDSRSEPIYDPYPTAGSAGFDLDAVGVSNGADYPPGQYVPPDIPSDDDDAGFGGDHGCFIASFK